MVTSGTRALFPAVILVTGMFVSVAAQEEKDGGFGVKKNNVTFVLAHPPKLLVTQKTCSLQVSGSRAAAPALVAALKQVIHGAKTGINFVNANGELRINLDLVFDYSQRESTRKVKVTRTNRNTQAQEEVEEEHRFVEVASTFEVSYEFQDWTGGQPAILDSGRVVAPAISQELDMTAGKEKQISEMEARSTGIAHFTRTMNPIFNETHERVEVILGKVKDFLKSGISLAESGNWDGALKAWQAVPPLQFPKAESYRVYDLGVANEALAHLAFKDAGDVDLALKHLGEARKMYEQAMRLKPDEKFFRESWRGFVTPLQRIEKALEAYTNWKARRDAITLANRGAVDDLLNDGAKRTRSRGDDTPGAMSNDDVIEMVKAKASDELIADTIAEVTSTKFDLSVQGKLNLLKNGVSERVIRLMQQKQQQQKP